MHSKFPAITDSLVSPDICFIKSDVTHLSEISFLNDDSHLRIFSYPIKKVYSLREQTTISEIYEACMQSCEK